MINEIVNRKSKIVNRKSKIVNLKSKMNYNYCLMAN
jgi:hypothetical protein